MTWLVLLFLSSLCWLVPVSLWFWWWLLLSVVVSFSSSSSSSSAAALLLLWILLMGATYNYMCTCIICVCVCVCGGGRGSGPITATNNWAMLVRTMTPLSCPFLSCIVCSIPMLFRFNHALNGFAKKNTVPPCRQKKKKKMVHQNGTSKYIAIQCLLLLWPSKWRPTWHSNHQLSCQGAVGRLWHLGCFGFRLAMAIDTDRETRLIDCWCITI